MIVQVEAILSLPLHALPPPSQLAPTLVSSYSCHILCPYYLIYCILRFCYQPVPHRCELVSSACLVKESKVALEPRAPGLTQLSLLKMRNTFRDLKQPSLRKSRQNSLWKHSAIYSKGCRHFKPKFLWGRIIFRSEMSLDGKGLPRRNSDYSSVEYWDQRWAMPSIKQPSRKACPGY